MHPSMRWNAWHRQSVPPGTKSQRQAGVEAGWQHLVSRRRAGSLEALLVNQIIVRT